VSNGVRVCACVRVRACACNDSRQEVSTRTCHQALHEGDEHDVHHRKHGPVGMRVQMQVHGYESAEAGTWG